MPKQVSLPQIGIMIEGQHGLNWERWIRILQAAEDLGFQCVFRSDHFTDASGDDLDSLELWVSLTYAASHTKRIEFGPLVTPTTFRHPAITVRMAAAVDDLSDGRLTLGMGAGWQEREHKKFGIPFYDRPTRFDMLEEALELTTRLLNSDEGVNFKGKHFSLEDAILLPRPKRKGGPPILIGGRGPKRTLPLVAKYAKEWNALAMPIEMYKERNALLDDLLESEGRKPNDVKRSLMTSTVLARNDQHLDELMQEQSKRYGQEVTAAILAEHGIIVGTPSMWVDQIGAFAEAGVERFALQWFDLDDMDGLETIAKEILPQVS